MIRAIGFAEPILGADIQGQSLMELDDLADTVNGLIAAGYIESIPYRDEVPMAEFPTVAFEINPAYAIGLKEALYRR